MSTLTPLWCSFCRCYVPKEREPHVGPKHRDPHYADFKDEDECKAWRRAHPDDDEWALMNGR